MYRPARAITNDNGSDVSMGLNALVSSAVKSTTPWKKIKKVMRTKSRRKKMCEMRIHEMMSSNRSMINLFGYMLHDYGIPKHAKFTLYSLSHSTSLVAESGVVGLQYGKKFYGISNGRINNWNES